MMWLALRRFLRWLVYGDAVPCPFCLAPMWLPDERARQLAAAHVRECSSRELERLMPCPDARPR